MTLLNHNSPGSKGIKSELLSSEDAKYIYINLCIACKSQDHSLNGLHEKNIYVSVPSNDVYSTIPEDYFC